MTYTLAQHQELLQQVQELLDHCRELIQVHEFKVNTGYLLGITPSGELVMLGYTQPFKTDDKIQYAIVTFVSVDSVSEKCSIQHDNQTCRVADSAKFHKGGWYLGVGHIQFGYHSLGSNFGDQGEYAGNVLLRLQQITEWQRVST